MVILITSISKTTNNKDLLTTKRSTTYIIDISNNSNRTKQPILNKSWLNIQSPRRWRKLKTRVLIISKKSSKPWLIGCYKRKKRWRSSIWLRSSITSLMSCMSNQSTKLWLKVQIESRWRRRSSTGYLKDGPSVSTSMILSILTFTIRRMESRMREVKSTDLIRWPSMSLRRRLLLFRCLVSSSYNRWENRFSSHPDRVRVKVYSKIKVKKMIRHHLATFCWSNNLVWVQVRNNRSHQTSFILMLKVDWMVHQELIRRRQIKG